MGNQHVEVFLGHDGAGTIVQIPGFHREMMARVMLASAQSESPPRSFRIRKI